MIHHTTRYLGLVAVAVSVSAALTACSAPSTEEDSAPAAAGSIDLASACPATIVVQTDWNPTADHGAVYQMLGPDPQIDASKMAVSGDLYAGGEPTGVSLEIRAGGPAIGFQPVSSQMLVDPQIMLGYGALDSLIATSSTLPTTAIYATYDKSPQVIMWDPATYPDVKEISDLATTEATVRYYDGATFMDYLVESGQLRADQVDGSYDGSPAAFVAAAGADAQQGYATNEPYAFENEIASWGKPIDYALIADAGYTNYNGVIFGRSADLDTNAECLTRLVPVIQQAQVDYLADPASVNELIVTAVEQYDNGIVYTREGANNAVQVAVDDALVGNGANAMIGDFDDAAVASLFDIVAPISMTRGAAPSAGLTAADVYTNRFLDSSIGVE